MFARHWRRLFRSCPFELGKALAPGALDLGEHLAHFGRDGEIGEKQFLDRLSGELQFYCWDERFEPLERRSDDLLERSTCRPAEKSRCEFGLQSVRVRRRTKQTHHLRSGDRPRLMISARVRHAKDGGHLRPKREFVAGRERQGVTHRGHGDDRDNLDPFAPRGSSRRRLRHKLAIEHAIMVRPAQPCPCEPRPAATTAIGRTTGRAKQRNQRDRHALRLHRRHSDTAGV